MNFLNLFYMAKSVNRIIKKHTIDFSNTIKNYKKEFQKIILTTKQILIKKEKL